MALGTFTCVGIANLGFQPPPRRSVFQHPDSDCFLRSASQEPGAFREEDRHETGTRCGTALDGIWLCPLLQLANDSAPVVNAVHVEPPGISRQQSICISEAESNSPVST